jgi:uncharacterized protein involved in exopolysaccharide biosynthesis
MYDFSSQLKAHLSGMLAVFFLIALPTAAIMIFLQAPEYEATSSILIRQGKRQGSLEMKPELAVLHSDALAEQVIAAVGPERLFPEQKQADRAGQFQRRLQAQPVQSARIVELIFRHSDPELAVQTVKTLVKFLELELEKLNDPQTTLLEEELLLRRQQMQQAQNVLSMFRQNDHLQGNDWQLQYLEIKRGRLEAVLEEEIKKEQALAEELAELRRQFAVLPADDAESKEEFLKMKIYQQELLRKYEAKEPLIASVDNQLALLRQQVKADESWEKLADRLVLASTAHATQQEEREAAQRELNQLIGTLRQQEEQKRIFSSLEAEVERSRELYAQQLSKVEGNRKVGVNGYVTVIEPPQLPLEPCRPKKLSHLVVATVLGLLGSLLYGFLQQRRTCHAGAERD